MWQNYNYYVKTFIRKKFNRLRVNPIHGYRHDDNRTTWELHQTQRKKKKKSIHKQRKYQQTYKKSQRMQNHSYFLFG